MAKKTTEDQPFVSPAVEIRAAKDGFRRAGMSHPATPVVHPAGTFTEDQMRALLADPDVFVTVLADEPEAAPTGD